MISEQVRILNLRKNKLMDAVELEKEWGIRPDQVVDFLSLTGDTVDNVPGVPGIGEGFASTFLKQFGTLDNLLANVNQVKGPKKQLKAYASIKRPLCGRAACTIARRPSAGPRLGGLENAESPDIEAVEIAVHRVRLPPVPRRIRALSKASCRSRRNRGGRLRTTPSIRPSGAR